MAVVDSVDNQIESSSTNGQSPRLLCMTIAATTAANTTSGYTSWQRFFTPYTVPAFGGSVTGALYTSIRAITDDAGSGILVGLEYLLGTLTVSGNSFADGVEMPTKTITGASVATATETVFAVATVAMTATTPVLTITYKDQNDNTGQTATLTLPTNVAKDSAFLITPHLAAGDTGVKDVSNISISTGSAGTIKVYGLLVLAEIPASAIGPAAAAAPPMILPKPKYIADAGDIIAFYRSGVTGSGDMAALLSAVGET